MVESDYICKIEGCGKRAHTRGVCQNCYRKAANLVKNGETSWEELEEMGLVDSSKKTRSSAFAKMFEMGKNSKKHRQRESPEE